MDKRTRILTTHQSPLAAHTNRASRYEHISHSTPQNNTYGGNGHSTNHT